MAAEVAGCELLENRSVVSNKSPCQLTGTFFFQCLFNLSAADQANQEEQDDCTDDRNYDAWQVEAGDALRAELIKEPTPDECADDAHHDVGNGAHLFIFPHDHARDPACERTEDNPY